MGQGQDIAHEPYPAEWHKIDVPGAIIRYRPDGRPYNAAEGGWRNQRMLDHGKPALVLAFRGNRGTADMCRRAEAAGVPVYRIGWTREG